ncbi:hypothetical protein MSG28_009283 [Choristoneura fumiferana]|uniref:Uncharacterized protein n=1 Tax=Choristoneura fumiferana TaxID=7141 RepID=A0ACC0KXG7_CHOFU|nr:hypothetical protein MSG28_009283 [Choristoneura fumiferana]
MILYFKQQCLRCCVSAWRVRQPVKSLALEGRKDVSDIFARSAVADINAELIVIRHESKVEIFAVKESHPRESVVRANIRARRAARAAGEATRALHFNTPRILFTAPLLRATSRLSPYREGPPDALNFYQITWKLNENLLRVTCQQKCGHYQNKVTGKNLRFNIQAPTVPHTKEQRNRTAPIKREPPRKHNKPLSPL